MKMWRSMISLAAVCSLTFLATGCSWFGSDEKKVPPKASMIDDSSLSGPEMSGADALGADGKLGKLGDASALSSRPAGEWTPLTDKKFKPIYFAFDRYDIATTQLEYLDGIAQYLTENPNVCMIIEGNCDERGSAEYNMSLGERRAIAARDYLVSKGIADNRFQTISYGFDRPANPGHDEKAWAENRRDELIPAMP